jgi:hypothetical protein
VIPMTHDNDYDERIVSIIAEFDRRRAKLHEQARQLEDWRDEAIRAARRGASVPLPDPNVIEWRGVVLWFEDEASALRAMRKY